MLWSGVISKAVLLTSKWNGITYNLPRTFLQMKILKQEKRYTIWIVPILSRQLQKGGFGVKERSRTGF